MKPTVSWLWTRTLVTRLLLEDNCRGGKLVFVLFLEQKQESSVVSSEHNYSAPNGAHLGEGGMQRSKSVHPGTDLGWHSLFEKYAEVIFSFSRPCLDCYGL